MGECLKNFDESTPKFTVNNMTVGEVHKACKHESICLKLAKLLSGLVTGAVALACCIYFTKGYQNVTALQPYCTDFITNTTLHPYCDNSTFYDIDFGFSDGPFTDDVEAKHY